MRRRRSVGGSGAARPGLILCAVGTVLVSLAIAHAGAAKCSGREADPDCALYRIVRKCVDTSAADYCTICPSPRTGYCPAKPCEQTTEVWAGNPKYVAIRDLTMCSCPQVTHGLVLPMGAVTGVEDPDRPPAIWKFAWDVAAFTLPPEQVALIVNSQAHRSQAQLHVHILPLEPRKRAALEQLPYEAVPNLYNVWTKADAIAASRGLRMFGVLVHKEAPKEGAAAVAESWHVHVTDGPLVEEYTLLPDCQKPEKR